MPVKHNKNKRLANLHPTGYRSCNSTNKRLANLHPTGYGSCHSTNNLFSSIYIILIKIKEIIDLHKYYPSTNDSFLKPFSHYRYFPDKFPGTFGQSFNTTKELSENSHEINFSQEIVNPARG